MIKVNEELNALKIGYSGGIICGLGMLLLSLAATVGMYTGATKMMEGWHMFYSLTVIGTITGMLEAAIIGFLFFFSFAALYNWMN